MAGCIIDQDLTRLQHWLRYLEFHAWLKCNYGVTVHQGADFCSKTKIVK